MDAVQTLRNIFPEMDREVISAVLQHHRGRLDPAVETLLAMNRGSEEKAHTSLTQILACPPPDLLTGDVAALGSPSTASTSSFTWPTSTNQPIPFMDSPGGSGWGFVQQTDPHDHEGDPPHAWTQWKSDLPESDMVLSTGGRDTSAAVAAARACHCIAYGAGLTGGIAGLRGTFTIQSRDTTGKNVEGGGDTFLVRMTGVGTVPVEVEDRQDGTYGASLLPTKSGNYLLSITLGGAHISGSPFKFTLFPAETRAGNCIAHGTGLTSATAGVPATFTVQLRDAYGNNCTSVSGSIAVQFLGPTPLTAETRDAGDGSVIVSFRTTTAGTYRVLVTLHGVHISCSPFVLTVHPGPCDPSKCVATGPGLSLAKAGRESVFQVYGRDQWGNELTMGGNTCAVHITGATKMNTGERIQGVVVGDRQDGTYTVTYTPTNVGEYNAMVLLSGHNISGSPFRLFVEPAESHPESCVASGAGLVGGVAGGECRFTVEARDAHGNHRVSGGDRFEVSLSGASTVYGEIEDRDDGTYYVFYTPYTGGNYLISITLCGVHIADSPFHAVINPAVTEPEECTAFGPGIAGSIIGMRACFTVQAKDAYGNKQLAGGDEVAVNITTSGQSHSANVHDNDDGTYSVEFDSPDEGMFSIEVRLCGHHIQGSPFRAVAAGLDLFKRGSVLKEIYESEQNYVKSLENIVELFLNPLRRFAKSRDPIIPHDAINKIFSNVEIVLTVNRDMLAEFEQRMREWPNVMLGDVFKARAPFLKIYSAFVSNYHNAISTVSELRKQPPFANFLSDVRDKPESGGLDIVSYLIMPVQRLPRYKLLLEHLLKETPEYHPDHEPVRQATELMKGLVVFVNDNVKKAENLQKVLNIQNSLSGRIPNLVEPHRRYVREGAAFRLSSLGKRLERYIFLFNDILVLTKRNLVFKSHIGLLNASVDPFEDASDTGLLIQSSAVALRLVFETQDEGNTWLSEVSRVVAECKDNLLAREHRAKGKADVRGRQSPDTIQGKQRSRFGHRRSDASQRPSLRFSSSSGVSVPMGVAVTDEDSDTTPNRPTSVSLPSRLSSRDGKRWTLPVVDEGSDGGGGISLRDSLSVSSVSMTGYEGEDGLSLESVSRPRTTHSPPVPDTSEWPPPLLSFYVGADMGSSTLLTQRVSLHNIVTSVAADLGRLRQHYAYRLENALREKSILETAMQRYEQELREMHKRHEEEKSRLAASLKEQYLLGLQRLEREAGEQLRHLEMRCTCGAVKK